MSKHSHSSRITSSLWVSSEGRGNTPSFLLPFFLSFRTEYIQQAASHFQKRKWKLSSLILLYNICHEENSGSSFMLKQIAIK